MSDMLIGLNFADGFYFVADKYYGSGRSMEQLIDKKIHIVIQPIWKWLRIGATN